MTFKERLKDLREQAGLTQTALAEASGCSLGVIRDYEQGKAWPGFHAFFQLCRALGVDANVFKDCAEDAAPEPPRAKGRPRKATTEANGQGGTTPKKTPRKRKGK